MILEASGKKRPVICEERHRCWNVEGWVHAALRNWANRRDGIQIVHHTSERWIEILVDNKRVASVFVDKRR